MECLGGNGYVEEWPLARAYREAPVNAIWEGSGNVMALDALRAAARAAEAARAVVSRLNEQCGLPPETLDLESDLTGGAEHRARRTCERLGRLATAAALAEGTPALAEAYVATRLTGEAYGQFGAGDLAGAETALIERILPAQD
jgi:putative acyl-CoA dehydrogenase